MFPPEPPVAILNSPERRAAGKGARLRDEVNPCRRAPLWHFSPPLDGRRSGNTVNPAGELLSKLASGSCRSWPRFVRARLRGPVIVLSLGQHRPGNPRQLVRHRDDRHIAMHPTFQLTHPGVQRQSVSMGLMEHRSCAMDEQTSQIGIAALTDAEQLRLSSRRMLSRDQAQPRREVAPLDERRSISDRSLRIPGEGERDSGVNAKSVPLASF